MILNSNIQQYQTEKICTIEGPTKKKVQGVSECNARCIRKDHIMKISHSKRRAGKEGWTSKGIKLLLPSAMQ